MKNIYFLILTTVCFSLHGQVQLKSYALTSYYADGSIFFIDSTALFYPSDNHGLLLSHKPQFTHGNELLYRSFFPNMEYEFMHYLKPEAQLMEFERLEKYRWTDGANALVGEQIIEYNNALPIKNTQLDDQGEITFQARYLAHNANDEITRVEMYYNDTGTLELIESIDVFYTAGFPYKRSTERFSPPASTHFDSIVSFGDTLISVFKGVGIPYSKADYRFVNSQLKIVQFYSGTQNETLGDRYRLQYDGIGRIRRIFRDLRHADGSMILGYETLEYGYNSQNNITTIKIYGDDLEPVGYWTYAYTAQEYVSTINYYSSSPGNWIEQLTGQRRFHYDENLRVRELDAVSFEIYPNPNKGEWHVSSTANIELIQVFNSLGQCIAERPVNASKTLIQLNEPPGVYHLKLTANGQTYNRKVVLQ